MNGVEASQSNATPPCSDTSGELALEGGATEREGGRDRKDGGK